MRKSKTKYKKNPFPIIVIGGITLLSSTGLAVIAGASVLGLVLMAAISESDYTPSTYEIYKKVRSILKRLDANEFKDVNGYTAGLHVERGVEINQATQAPTTVAQAYLQAAYLLSLAAIYNGNDAGLAKEATKFFNRLPKVESKTGAELNEKEKIRQILDQANEILKAHPQASKFSRLITEVTRKSDDGVIQSEMNFQESQSKKQFAYEAAVETIDDASRPFQLAAALVSGKKPHFLSPTQWKFVKYGTYSALGIGILLTIRAYLPK